MSVSISADLHFKDFRHALARKQFRCRAAQYFSLMQPDDLLRVFAHQRQIVRDEQDRELLFDVDLLDEFQQYVRGGGIQTRRRFVED